MPANKNAVIRYMFLDQMLSDRNNYYTRGELCDKVNDKLRNAGYTEVSKRTIELDLIDMSYAPFYMDINDDLIVDGKHIVRYADQTQSLFSRPISEDEKKLLMEVLNTLGQFSGIDNFSWLEDLQNKLNDKVSFGHNYDMTDSPEARKVIQFSSNPYLKNRNYLSGLFSAISNKQVLSIDYRKFQDSNLSSLKVYPYLLKQYNERWYLICTPVGTKEYPYNANYVMNLALDRIESFSIEKRQKYKESPIDIDERYDEILGVTFYEDAKLEKIVFAIKNTSAPYLETKPIHGSQTRLCTEEQERLHSEFSSLADYTFYSIECRINWELKSWICSYSDAMVIIQPSSLRQDILTSLNELLRKYTTH